MGSVDINWSNTASIAIDDTENDWIEVPCNLMEKPSALELEDKIEVRLDNKAFDEGNSGPASFYNWELKLGNPTRITHYRKIKEEN